MSAMPLFDVQPRFDSGVALGIADHIRLGAQLARVLSVMSDGAWMTVPEMRQVISARFLIADPEQSIGAQIRNLRKQKHGGHQIERRRVANQYEFRLVTP